MEKNNCQSCDRVPSNKYNSCPALMSDGRLFTNYNTRCAQVSDMFDKKLNSYDYRQFLIKNAGGLIDSQRKAAYEASFCGPCKQPVEQSTMLPEEETTVCSSSTCNTNVTNPKGLGRGRNFQVANNLSNNNVQSCIYNQFAAVKAEESDGPEAQDCCGISSYPFNN